MPKYRVYATVIGTKLLGEFKAESVDQAKHMAIDSDGNYINLCHQCAKEVSELQIDDNVDYIVEEVS